MRGDDLARDPQPETRALPDRLRREEALEDALGDSRSEAGARVFDSQPHRFRIAAGRKAQDLRRAAPFHCVHRVDDQVDHHLLESSAIPADRRQIIDNGRLWKDALITKERTQNGERPLGQLADRDRFVLQLLRPRDTHQVAHDGGGAPRFGEDTVDAFALLGVEVRLTKQLGEKTDCGQRVVHLMSDRRR